MSGVIIDVPLPVSEAELNGVRIRTCRNGRCFSARIVGIALPDRAGKAIPFALEPGSPLHWAVSGTIWKDSARDPKFWLELEWQSPSAASVEEQDEYTLVVSNRAGRTVSSVRERPSHYGETQPNGPGCGGEPCRLGVIDKLHSPATR